MTCAKANSVIASKTRLESETSSSVRHDTPYLHLHTVSYVHLQPTMILTVVVGSSLCREKYSDHTSSTRVET